MASMSVLIHRLQTAINMRGGKILYQTSQFFSDEQNRPITVYSIKKMIWDEDKQKEVKTELFHSCSQIQVVLFLRDMWEEMNKDIE